MRAGCTREAGRLAGRYPVWRAWPDQDQSSSQEQLVSTLLAPHNETGTGQVSWSDPLDLEKPFEIRSRFKLDAIANLPGPGAITIPVGVGPGYLARLIGEKPPAKRQFPFACQSLSVREDTYLEFPSTVKITRIPADTRIDDGVRRYVARYSLKANAVEVRREYREQYPSGRCSPKDNDSLKAFHRRLVHDLRAQVSYQ
jgi:hypothetical protein